MKPAAHPSRRGQVAAPQDEESFQRADRVQVSLPQSMPTQPSTFRVSGPDPEMLLAGLSGAAIDYE